ncbi:MAG TPA: RNA-binding cell elongation regulator Jag/EloR [Acidimicrobiales bacterium]|nr:RNA-binding cell elongation regulator Jag/EloR [Acidimicrobiales bacterium]
MEWVETTGRTVEEALDIALDELGVDGADAEYEIIEEPKVGLFGRLRTEARVRARVRPTKPRPKEDRAGRRSSKGTKAKAPSESSTKSAGPATTVEDSPEPAEPAERPAPDAPQRGTVVTDSDVDVPIAEQGEVAIDFLRGVLERFGVADPTITADPIDDSTIEVQISGDDLGLLIGPRGATLQSIQELTRTVVQRQTSARSGRILVDVGGYRQRRREALARFAETVADDVRSSGTRVVLEPMSPADRKVIHDTVNGIDGVATTSEGEEPRRRVVVYPA